MTERGHLPVAVIGAGPIGLAAAARLLEQNLTPLVLERGPTVGTFVQAWGHVRVFSPWAHNIDAAARSLLEQTGWTAPDASGLPTGAEIVRDYLTPLARHPDIVPHLNFNSQVTAITRAGLDKMTSTDREQAPFLLRWRTRNGTEQVVRARAVVDATGTWDRPNPMGVDGLPVPGEREASERIAYGIPDVLGKEREAYGGRRVLVVGSGHSAINVVIDLLRLQQETPEMRIAWALRKNGLNKLLGGGRNDQLPGRGALGLAAMRAIDAKRIEMLAPFAAEHIGQTDGGLSVAARLDQHRIELTVDRIVVATGFRPNLDLLRELRVALDPALEAPPALAPLIDPNLHSCGTVPPHGAAELAHPEPGFYIVGSKSYGRAPTFLLATGYEQVRSVAAEIAGNHLAAREVQLVLPETGVCNTAPVTGPGATSPCCGGPAPAAAKACCMADAEAKSKGAGGCGCTSTPKRAVGGWARTCCAASV